MARGLGDGHLLLGEGRGDKGAGADAGFEVALSNQLGIGIEDGKARDAKHGGKFSTGKNLRAGSKVAAENGGAVAVIDLFVQRTGVGTVNGEDGECFVHRVFHNSILVVMANRVQVAMATCHFFVRRVEGDLCAVLAIGFDGKIR